MLPQPNYLNANKFSLTFPILLGSLANSGLRWEMNYSQVLALEIFMYMRETSFAGVQDTTPSEDVERFKELAPSTRFMVFGLPVVVRDDYPKTLIRLMCNDQEIYRIENLAVPAAVKTNTDWNEEERSEREKFNKIVYGD